MEFQQLADDKMQEYARKGKKLHFSIYDINKVLILDDFSHVNPFNSDTISSVIMVLSWKITGEKIFQYRKLIKEKIHSLSSEKRAKIMSRVLDQVWEIEVLVGMNKLLSRIPGMKENEKIVTEARLKLWKNRLEKLWGPW
jgi:hypothetical protein